MLSNLKCLAQTRRTLFKADEKIALRTVLWQEDSRFTDQNLVSIGTLLMLAGLAFAITAVLASLFRQGRFRARGGAVVIIGPFPIVFGSDRQSARVLLILAIILVVLLLGFFFAQIFF